MWRYEAQMYIVVFSLSRLHIDWCATTVDAELLMWGLNQHGQCAVGSVTEDSRTQPKSDVLENCKLGASNWITNVYLPLRVEVKGDKFAVSEVRCGWSHTVAVTG